MTAVFVTFAGLATVGGLAFWLNQRLKGLSRKQKKKLFKRKVSGVFTWFEERGLLQPSPAFNREYLCDYPALRILEENYPVVREECLALLRIKDRLTDMKTMGGTYTQK